MVSCVNLRMWIGWVFEPCNQLKAKIVCGISDTGAAIICNQIFREVDGPMINQGYKGILILPKWNGFNRHTNNIFPYHLNPRSEDKPILIGVFCLISSWKLLKSAVFNPISFNLLVGNVKQIQSSLSGHRLMMFSGWWIGFFSQL